MLAIKTKQNFLKYFEKLDKKQYTPKNIDKEFFSAGRYFLFDCYGNLLYVGSSNPSKKSGEFFYGNMKYDSTEPEGIKKELRKFYQQDTTKIPVWSGYHYDKHTDEKQPKESERSTHPSANPEIRKRVCMYAVDYETKTIGNVPCGLWSKMPRYTTCSDSLNPINRKFQRAGTTYRWQRLTPEHTKHYQGIIKKLLPKIYNKEKQIAKRPIIKCDVYDKKKMAISCKAIRFVKPIK